MQMCSQAMHLSSWDYLPCTSIIKNVPLGKEIPATKHLLVYYNNHIKQLHCGKLLYQTSMNKKNYSDALLVPPLVWNPFQEYHIIEWTWI